MNINYEILANGDLKFTVKFDDENERKEAISCNDTRAGYDWFLDEILEDSELRLMDDEEKQSCGDLYGGDILTTIDEDMFDESTAYQIDNETWFYRYYATHDPSKQLYEEGEVVWTCRKNL